MEERNIRLLVVDDNRIERMKLSRSLRGQGYAVDTADNGLLALEMLRTQQFDLVLLDIVMPGMDGHQVLKEIKDDDKLRVIPVIVISGFDDSDSVQLCMDLGAKNHLSKPVTTDSLTSCVEVCLDKQPSRDQET